MSMYLTAEALKLKLGNPLRKLVLVKLADNANDNGVCFPSIKYLAQLCECSESAVKNHINDLVAMGLVTKFERKTPNGNLSNIYKLHLEKGEKLNADLGGLNADPEGLTAGPDGLTADPDGLNNTLTPRQEVATNQSYNQSINHNNTSQPQAVATPLRAKFHFSESDMNLAKSIFAKIRLLNPNHREPNFNSWANELRLMVERDGKSQAEIFDLFLWANQDSFWHTNILSPKKLREKWDVLILQRSRKKPQGRVDNLSQAWNTPEAWEGVL